MKRLLREPLLHFIAIGAVLFALFSVVNNEPEAATGEIVVTAGQIASLQDIFARTRQRPPTEAETASLIDDYVRDEVFYREGLAMGLDRDDAVMRSRMRQKMELVADAISEAEPTEAELTAYVGKNPERFRTEPRFTFRHIYFRTDDRPAPTERTVAHLLGELKRASAAETEELGDPFMPGHVFDGLTRSETARIFGESFAQSLAELNLGRWDGPVASAYGIHLVFVTERSDQSMPPFPAIRELARREWQNERRVESRDALFEKLRSRYVIRLEETEPVRGPVAEATP